MLVELIWDIASSSCAMAVTMHQLKKKAPKGQDYKDRPVKEEN